MSIDSVIISAITSELKKNIINFNINKIYEPERYGIVVLINKIRLLISADPSCPKICVTKQENYNPQEAPAFCMLLRKYILNSKIINVSQYEFDRIIIFEMQSINNFGDIFNYKLIAEIMGKYSNIILIDENNKIIDSIRHVDATKSSVRYVLPNLIYKFPIAKKNPLIINQKEFVSDLSKRNDDNNNFFCEEFNGMNQIIQKEIYFRKKKYPNKKYWDIFNAIMSDIKKNIYNFEIILNENNEAKILSGINLEQYEDKNKIKFNNVFDAIEFFLRGKIITDNFKQTLNNLDKTLKKIIARYQKKIEIQKSDLDKISDKEIFRLCGELIMANIYKIKTHSDFFIANNYYNNNREIKIELDKNLSASQNAQAYFKKYNYKKRSEIALKEQIEKKELELKYLCGVKYNLSLCEDKNDLENIQQELYEQKIIKKNNYKKNNKSNIKKNNKFVLLHFVSQDGFDIYAGKNNLQNDYLTFKFAKPKDIWLHAKNIPSAHVIIKTNNKFVSDETILEAAKFCATNSKSDSLSKILIDYTTRKHVKKIPGAKPGMVIYENYKTICVD
jgi:predicted ribosome quality control (RQC) complex YloA/Tae2 family protein